jgi:hypothetical protein
MRRAENRQKRAQQNYLVANQKLHEHARALKFKMERAGTAWNKASSVNGEAGEALNKSNRGIGLLIT